VAGFLGDDWNSDLNDMNNKYTYFAPSEAAWKELEAQMPSEHFQLTSGKYPYHGRQILDRHLIVGKLVKTNQLEDNYELQTRRANLIVRKDQLGGHTSVEWEGVKASITRPDVQVVNGVIHVIDKVLMLKRDMTVNSANTSSVSVIAIVLMAIISLKLF